MLLSLKNAIISMALGGCKYSVGLVYTPNNGASQAEVYIYIYFFFFVKIEGNMRRSQQVPKLGHTDLAGPLTVHITSENYLPAG